MRNLVWAALVVASCSADDGSSDPLDSGPDEADTDTDADTDADTDTDTDADSDTDTDSDTDADPLETAIGCAGVFNPDQMLDLRLDLDPGDWNTVLSDMTYDAYFRPRSPARAMPRSRSPSAASGRAGRRRSG